MRRLAHRSRRSTLFGQVMRLSQGMPQFFAGLYSGSATVDYLFDFHDPAKRLVGGSSKAALPAAHADFAGNLCITTTGAEAYQSNATMAAWVRTADGSNIETFRLFTPLAGAGTRVLDATTFAGVAPGHQFYWDPASSVTVSLNRSGGGSQDVVTPQSLNATAVGTPTYASVRFANPGDPNQFECRRKGSLAASGAFSNPPTASGVSAQPLTLFSNAYPGASLGAICRWVWWGAFPALTAQQRSVIHAWILEEYGIAP
jgi:hypothetical protein